MYVLHSQLARDHNITTVVKTNAGMKNSIGHNYIAANALMPQETF